MRLAEVRGPVDDGEEAEAHGEHHERELVERAMLRAAEHDAAVHGLPQPRHEAARHAVPRRHRLQYRRVLHKQTILTISLLRNLRHTLYFSNKLTRSTHVLWFGSHF